MADDNDKYMQEQYRKYVTGPTEAIMRFEGREASENAERATGRKNIGGRTTKLSRRKISKRD